MLSGVVVAKGLNTTLTVVTVPLGLLAAACVYTRALVVLSVVNPLPQL